MNSPSFIFIKSRCHFREHAVLTGLTQTLQDDIYKLAVVVGVNGEIPGNFGSGARSGPHPKTPLTQKELQTHVVPGSAFLVRCTN